MMWIVGLIVVATGLALLLFFVAAIVLAVIELVVRLALGACLAIAAGGVVGVVATQAGADGTVIGFFTTVLGFVPALLLVGRWRSSMHVPPAGDVRRAASAISDAALDPYEQAWATAREFVPKAALDGAQDASARILALSEREGSIDPEVIDCAITLRRHVPALVGETEELLATADRAEREAAVAELVADLRNLGLGAADLLARQGFSAREKLAVRRARLFGTKLAV